MSEWLWIALGYGVAYGAFGGYLLSLHRRRLRLVRRREELR